MTTHRFSFEMTRRQIVKSALAFGGSTLLTARLGVAGDSSTHVTDGWPPAAILADFDELYPRLREAHFNLYARRSRHEYDAKFRILRRTFERPLPRDRLFIELQRFMAYGRIAHAYCGEYWSPFQKHMAGGGKQFPLSFKVIKGKAYITENFSDRDEISVGDELTRVNRRSFEVLRPRLHAYLSADNEHLADTLLEQQVAIAVWFELGSLDTFEIELRRADGSQRTLTLPGATWADVDARRAASKSAQNTDWNARLWKMLEGDVGYLRPGPFYNHDGGSDKMYDTAGFAHFVDDAFQELIKAGARKLIIDLRNNPGGDNSFSDLMVSWVANKPFKFASEFRIKVSEAAIASNRKRVEAGPDDQNSASFKLAAAYAGRRNGEVFSYEIPTAQPRAGERFNGVCHVLVNRYSYSNAVNVAALMQDYGFGKILGEETSDLATSYGAMEQFKLTRTGIDIGFPKALIIRPSGATDARGVVPDVSIETPLLERPEDEVLAAAVEIVRSRKT